MKKNEKCQFMFLFIAIYTGHNPIYSQPKSDQPKSFKHSFLNAFRINYIFWALIIFFAMKGEYLHPPE